MRLLGLIGYAFLFVILRGVLSSFEFNSFAATVLAATPILIIEYAHRHP